MAATRKRAKARAPAARAKGARRARSRAGADAPAGSRQLRLSLARMRPRLPVLDQRGRDVLGLALVAVGVFMAFVLYGGWDGGRRRAWPRGGARLDARASARAGAGGARRCGGGVLLLRPVLPALRPLRAGAICLFAAVTLALAAGTLGVSSAPPRRRRGLDARPICRRTAGSSARRSTSSPTGSCRASGSTSSSCSCCSSA